VTTESLVWFVAQGVVAGVAVPAGLRIAKQSGAVWKAVATLAAAAMLFWPLLRVFPGEALRVFGASTIVFLEVTGIIIPAALLFTIAARTMRHARERRAVALLLIVCGLYYVKTGWWMVGPPVPELRTSTYRDGICRQSTGYTCVAASLVTLLRAHGIEATETEMARLSYTEIHGGATDTRAVLALERKLRDLRAPQAASAPNDGDSSAPSAGRSTEPSASHSTAPSAAAPAAVRLRPELLTLRDPRRLADLPLPALVSTRWGYFISHMMPLLAVDEAGVTVGDPMSGPRHIPMDEFRREWRGWAIVLRAE
jgi:hypothetical protein